VEQLTRALQAIDEADRNGPRDTFDLQAVIHQKGNDPAKIFEWVRDQTIWVPYNGSLRERSVY